MKSSPRKSLETCNTLMQELDSPLILDPCSPDSYYEKYELLKAKYLKLYKDYNLLLKSCDLKSSESRDDECFRVLNRKIVDQQREISELRGKVDKLNGKVEKGKGRRMSVGVEAEWRTGESGIEVSADVCLIGLLIHRLILGQRFGKDDLLKYRMALHRIEVKFSELSGKGLGLFKRRSLNE